MQSEQTRGGEIRAVYFDWGGVLAEEGFFQGTRAMARAAGLEPEEFFHTASRTMWDTGFVTGGCDEAHFWNVLRETTGIKGSDAELREEILSRFVARPWMFDLVARIKATGLGLGILSDQTNWLDELDAKYKVFQRFDVVLNSFYSGHTKGETAFFDMAVERMGLPAESMVFVDDNPRNIEVGTKRGFHCILYTDRPAFEAAFANLVTKI